jgi:hypothetical protein
MFRGNEVKPATEEIQEIESGFHGILLTFVSPTNGIPSNSE